MKTRSQGKLQPRQTKGSLAAKPRRQNKLKQQILRRHVSSSCSSNRSCQLRRHCQSCPENMAYQQYPLGYQTCSLNMESQEDPPVYSEAMSCQHNGLLALCSAGEVAMKGKAKEKHTWTTDETAFTLAKLDSDEKRAKYKKNKQKFLAGIESEMDGKFSPEVSFEGKGRKKMQVICSQWSRRKRAEASGSRISETLPISLLDKYDETIKFIATESSSSSSVQVRSTPSWTNKRILKHLADNKVDGKKILKYNKALQAHKDAASLFYLYTDLDSQTQFLEQISL